MDAATAIPSLQLAWTLRTVPCNLCGSTDYRELYPARLERLADRDIQEIFACTSSAFGECGPIVRCTACGFVYQNPQPEPGTVLSAYESIVDVRYAEEREGRVHTFGRALAELEEYAVPGRLLDVGSHLGVFVEVAREGGWDAEGVEPSRWAANVARNRSLPVWCGTIGDLPAREPYDVITMWDVIEHFTDPAGELRRAHELLRPDGLIAISTMDVDAPVARLLGRHWPWYMQMHLFYFSRRTLARLVEQAGFDVLNVRRHRRVLRVSYALSRTEGRLGPLYPPLARFVEGVGLADRLVTIDLGDIVTLFARRRSADSELDAVLPR
ncbi:MAG: hypothetical protein QOF51_582 [Chloroflexota bacterium]|jgi:2-polyprenyl-3-methyl-5-hydroxy-6-metoxy-1,4-benzoquinol methylase|nr:hypothetical protein [Chloroflexota bacterium]